MTGYTDEETDEDDLFSEDEVTKNISLKLKMNRALGTSSNKTSYKSTPVRAFPNQTNRFNLPITLNKIEEVDESRIKSPEVDEEKAKGGEESDKKQPPSPHVMWKDLETDDNRHKTKTRPRSANCLQSRRKEEQTGSGDVRKTPSKIPRPRSCESKLNDYTAAPKSALKINARRKSDSDTGSSSSISDACKFICRKDSWENLSSDEYDSTIGLSVANEIGQCPSRPSSANGNRSSSTCTDDYLMSCKADWISYDMLEDFRRNKRRSISRPNSAQELRSRTSESAVGQSYSLHRFTRCLKLLGLDPEELGMSCRGECFERKQKNGWSVDKLKNIQPTFVTKLNQRSISLDCLKDIVRDATLGDAFIDYDQRETIAKAVYEEWYFKRRAEADRKKKEELMKKQKFEEQCKNEYLERKKKAEESFQKWMESKKIQIKKKKTTDKKKTQYETSRKTKEDAEKAFLNWKKAKEKKLREEIEKKSKLEERKRETERQKEEKKTQADKAFKEWKKKAENVLKTKEEKEKEKTESEKKKREKKEGSSSTSFQVWKSLKDEEIKKKLIRAKLAENETSASRSMQLAERLYEAEQAFEDWLEKVEERRIKQTKNVPKNKEISRPWAPN